MVEFTSLLSLQQHFNNELVCAEYLEQERWDGCPVCPHCGSEHHYRTKTRFTNPELKDYRDFVCKACFKKYTVLTGTIYEGSKVSLKKWFIAMYLLGMHKKGISSLQLARDIDVTQKTAWFMLHRIREMLQERAPEVLTGTVMSDETFVGGKNRFRHKDKKIKYKEEREFKDKTPILGLMHEDGFVRLIVTRDVTRDTIIPLVLEHVEPGCTLVTDDWKSYRRLNKDYHHEVVKHGNGQYMNEFGYTTNRLEGFWTTVKRSVIGIYHYVSRRHLHRYCHEWAYRYNHRKLSVFEKFRMAIRQCNDVRLLYKNLVCL